jgi:branched-chain amino acid transport system permease protein
MAGALYAMFIGQIYPQFVFDPVFDISIALMAIIGGLGTFVGPLLGALVLETLQQYVTLSYSNGSLYLIIYGAVFLVVVLFMPQGVVIALRDAWLLRKARREGQVTVGAAVSPRTTS